MVRDHEERGFSSFHHNCYHMAHVFESIILPPSLIVLPVSTSRISIGMQPSLRSLGEHFLFPQTYEDCKNKVFHRRMRDFDFETRL